MTVMIHIKDLLLRAIESRMNDLYVTPPFSWSLCASRKNEALTPRPNFEANASLAPLPRFTGQICLSTLTSENARFLQ